MTKVMESGASSKCTGLHTDEGGKNTYTSLLQTFGDAGGGGGRQCGHLAEDNFPNPNIVLQLCTNEALSLNLAA
jgi:hypothetical protein